MTCFEDFELAQAIHRELLELRARATSVTAVELSGLAAKSLAFQFCTARSQLKWTQEGDARILLYLRCNKAATVPYRLRWRGARHHLP